MYYIIAFLFVGGLSAPNFGVFCNSITYGNHVTQIPFPYKERTKAADTHVGGCADTSSYSPPPFFHSYTEIVLQNPYPKIHKYVFMEIWMSVKILSHRSHSIY